ncbi:MAG: VIT domain-containing protein, partial [candidate division KSB1 bacterium]|nr:VIT domain-containing protein [candidate division KSB1 bacterium]
LNFPKLVAENILTVHDPLQYGSNPAFIDTCILEIEPHGSYVEQTLILTYSDHGQYSSETQLEVVHQFELPAGAVINDLWLWLPDTVMKAIVIDTWTAHAIYDSIVLRARDPAFLAKKGNQFRLQVYPLLGGSYRKIRLNFITPVRFQVIPEGKTKEILWVRKICLLR